MKGKTKKPGDNVIHAAKKFKRANKPSPAGDKSKTMSEKIDELIGGPAGRIRILARNLRDDLSRLQVAILQENKHDIATHLGNAIERSIKLGENLSEIDLLKNSR